MIVRVIGTGLLIITMAAFLAEYFISTERLNELTLYTVSEEYVRAKYEPDEGIYLGAYVLQDIAINYSMAKFNQLTEKKHASFFRYLGYGKPFPAEWVEKVKSAGAVPHIALEPNDGLGKVADDEYLRTFAREAKNSGVPIFLRYASEMNGDWTQYSGNPELFIQKWRLVHDVLAEEAPNVIMVWTVFTFPESTIDSFYPGDEFVDWVGVNIYNVVFHNNSLENKADYEDPLKLLNYVYNTYSYKKPIQISEYGATHYASTDGKYYIDFAREKISRLYGNLPEKYPRVKSVYYFDVNNLVNAPPGRKINDYSVTNDPEILETYASLVKNNKYLTDVVPGKPGTVEEKLSYRGFFFRKLGKTYADLEFYKNYLNLDVEVSGKKAGVSDGTKTVWYNITSRWISKGYQNEYRNISGLPLEDVARDFGYRLEYNPEDNSMFIHK